MVSLALASQEPCGNLNKIKKEVPRPLTEARIQDAHWTRAGHDPAVVSPNLVVRRFRMSNQHFVVGNSHRHQVGVSMPAEESVGKKLTVLDSQRHALSYENLSAKQLAVRFGVPRTWILDNSKTHLVADPVPHIPLGKYRRYRWGSPDLAAWIERRVICQSEGSQSASAFDYEYLDSAQFAARLNISVSWVRDQVRTRAEEPIPHVRFGKYIRFRWGSPELETWAERRIVSDNNRTVSRAQRKETVQ